MTRHDGMTVRNLGKRMINALPPARSIWRRLQHRRSVAARPDIDKALGTIRSRWPAEPRPDAERPIFLLSSGWRCGSTLLQRLLMSAGDTILWGEPYHRCSITQRLADSIRAITPDWPPDGAFPSGTNGRLSDDQYLANLFPEPHHLRGAHRAFFDRLFAGPARDRGFARWGLKEVRLTADHASYLGWIYPGARFVFVIRDPYAAYRSYRMFRPWYTQWPDGPVLTAHDFGELWRTCAAGFIESDSAGRGMLIRYEELTAEDASIEPLERYVGLCLDHSILDRRMLDRRWDLQPLPAAELHDLRRTVDPLAGKLGYTPPR